MLCPQCGVAATRVIDSRPVEGGRSIRRRRQCEACDHRFTSYERLDPRLAVVKRSGASEPFSPAKLAAGVSAAFADRPMSGSDIEAVVSEIEELVRSQGSHQVNSEELGRLVLERLKTLDEVAYLRFASVYKEFRDVADFERELAELESAEQ
jgi:transcriptional repressor NrdR